MYDYSKLRGRIVEKYGTITQFSEEIGMSLASVSQKLNNKMAITRNDIESWAAALEIPSAEYYDYFFAHAV